MPILRQSSGTSMLAWCGGLTGGIGAASGYLGNSHLGTTNSSSSAPGYRLAAARTARKLRLRVVSNTLDTTTTITVRKNQADTTLSVSVAADTTGNFDDDDSVACVAGDQIDVIVSSAAGGGAANGITLSATLELA